MSATKAKPRRSASKNTPQQKLPEAAKPIDKKIDEKTAQKIQDLINKKTQPSNDFVAYKVDQIRSLQAERDVLIQRLNQAKSMISKLQNSIISLEGQIEISAVDIAKFENYEKKEKS